MLRLLLGLLLSFRFVIADDAADLKRRTSIAEKGRELFKNTKNHCKAFQDLAAFAVERTKSPGQVLEDLKFVLVGESLKKRGTGPLYIGRTPGARGDSGFKAELKDNSPQVEHAWAAIYIGKTMPPGSAEGLALWFEVLGPLKNGEKPSAADILLYSIGADIGQRLAANNISELPKVIGRTICE